jgi:putative iron-dependent peroxidase
MSTLMMAHGFRHHLGMPVSQQVVEHPASAAIFLVFTLVQGGERATRAVLADAGGIRRSVGFRVPEAGLSSVIGVGADAWDRLYGAPRPAHLHRLPEFRGPVHFAPSTPGDLLVHIRADRLDLCFELAQRLTEALGDAATVIDEVHGFRSFDERDLLGFVDGTENPEGVEALAAVTVGDEDPGFAGGSYAVVQKYVHDLTGWDALTVEAQEAVIGRTKLSNIELGDDVKPPDSHIALNVIEGPDGEQISIMRFNMPFGAVGTREFGTYFIGYASAPAVIEQMLTNMFLGTADAAHDRVLDFSTALTGTMFFAPPVDLLESAPATTDDDDDGPSLGIGSLRHP